MVSTDSFSGTVYIEDFCNIMIRHAKHYSTCPEMLFRDDHVCINLSMTAVSDHKLYYIERNYYLYL